MAVRGVAGGTSGSSAVTSLVAGSGVTLSPTSGVGDVTVSVNTGYVTSIGVGTGLATSSSGATTAITSTGSLFLKDTAVTAGTYGTTNAVATFTVNQQGQLTLAANLAIKLVAADITAGTFAIAQIGLTAASGGVVYGTATAIGITAAGTTGQILISQGTAAPIWSTPAYPNGAGTEGQILRSNGTNIVLSTAVYPNISGSSGLFIRSNGTNFVTSSYTVPTAIGAESTFLRSDGTNIVTSTLVLPNSASTNGIFYGSAANTMGQIATATSGALITNGTGVPSITQASAGTVLKSTDGATVAFTKVDLSADVTGTLPSSNGGADPVFAWIYYQ